MSGHESRSPLSLRNHVFCTLQNSIRLVFTANVDSVLIPHGIDQKRPAAEKAMDDCRICHADFFYQSAYAADGI